MPTFNEPSLKVDLNMYCVSNQKRVGYKNFVFQRKIKILSSLGQLPNFKGQIKPEISERYRLPIYIYLYQAPC